MADQYHYHDQPKQKPPTSPSSPDLPQDDCFRDCQQRWIHQQKLDLRALFTIHVNHRDDDQTTNSAVARVMDHYRDYYKARTQLAQHNAPSVFQPSCGSEFSNAYLWLGGCRPSMYIRLVYVMAGLEIQNQLADLDRNGRSDVNIAGLTAHQLNCISELQCRTNELEDKLAKEMARLQEALADRPLIGLLLLPTMGRPGIDDGAAGVQAALQVYAAGLSVILEGADKLRLSTLSRVVEILSPPQALRLLIVATRLHLHIHQWGQSWDRMHQI